MKNTLFCLFIFCSVSTFAQNGITFKVEKLSKPEELLHLHSPNEIYESLILSDMDIEPYEIEEKNIKVPYHIIAKSESPDSPFLLALILFSMVCIRLMQITGHSYCLRT